MKKYNQAPLPFQGQKRRFLKAFKEALSGFSKDATYVDLFGGSGLLAHTVKQHYPDAHVVWNDYDNYLERLRAIPQTNELLSKLRPLVSDIAIKERLSDGHKLKILEVIKVHENQYDYLDYITLSASLLFSAKYVTCFKEMESQTMYNRVKATDYSAMDYLVGVKRVQIDYKSLYEHYKSDTTIFLVDPPYLSTDTSSYNKDNYWRLRDYLDVLNVLDSSSYFYFTSNKSQIVELCQWIETRSFTGNPFENAVMSTTANKLNHNAGYTDIMLYKYTCPD